MIDYTTFIYGAAAVICAALLAFASTPIVRVLAFRIKAVDVPIDGRRMHKKPVPRIGGLAIFFAFLVTTVAFTPYSPVLLTILVGGGTLVMLGILDDVYRLNAWLKLAVQILVATFAASNGITIQYIAFGGDYILFGAWSVPITIFWIVALTNAVNFIDGLDGLACGVSAIASVSVFFVTILSGDTTYSLLVAILAGACVGFFPFNSNPAKIFMGDTGALFLGYTLSILSVVGIFKTHMMLSFLIPLSIFGLPLFDTLFAVLRRIKHRKSLFEPDRGHIHHRLIDMGFGQKQSVRILYSVCAILGISAIMLTAETYISAIVIIISAFLIFALNYFILKNPKWRVHSGIYNSDEDAPAPPEEVVGTVPSVVREEREIERRAAHERERAEAREHSVYEKPKAENIILSAAKQEADASAEEQGIDESAQEKDDTEKSTNE